MLYLWGLPIVALAQLQRPHREVLGGGDFDLGAPQLALSRTALRGDSPAFATGRTAPVTPVAKPQASGSQGLEGVRRGLARGRAEGLVDRAPGA
jgi:hypothetical protein